MGDLSIAHGTLIDWNGRDRAELAAFGEERADDQLVRYHERAQLEADGQLTYREVLTEAMRLRGAPKARRTVGCRSGMAPLPEVPGR